MNFGRHFVFGDQIQGWYIFGRGSSIVDVKIVVCVVFFHLILAFWNYFEYFEYFDHFVVGDDNYPQQY